MREFLNYMLSEALITFGNKRPKYNNVVIMAGGAGSGKGYVLNNLIGIEGKVFDVDQLKKKVLKSKELKEKIKKDFEINVDELNLKNTKDVSTLHNIVSKLKLDKTSKEYLFNSIESSEYKPNLIYDVTLKDISKLINICTEVQMLGYKQENIHVVWVVNDVDIAQKQNKERERQVDPNILQNTHEGVALTMNKIFKGNVNLQDYMNGDFWVVFNKQYVDTMMQTYGNGGQSVGKALYFKFKEQFKKQKDYKDIAQKYISKIKDYVPKIDVNW